MPIESIDFRLRENDSIYLLPTVYFLLYPNHFYRYSSYVYTLPTVYFLLPTTLLNCKHGVRSFTDSF